MGTLSTLLQPAVVHSTRRQVAKAERAFDQSSMVSRAEGEDPGTHRKWRYACGKNYNHCKSINMVTADRMVALRQKAELYMAYEQAVHDIGEKHATRLDDGTLDLDRADPDNPQFKFTPEAKIVVDAEMAEITDQRDAAYAERDKINAEIEILYDEPVSLSLHRFPWDQVPERIGGTYLVELTPMLDGIPAELLDPGTGPADLSVCPPMEKESG